MKTAIAVLMFGLAACSKAGTVQASVPPLQLSCPTFEELLTEQVDAIANDIFKLSNYGEDQVRWEDVYTLLVTKYGLDKYDEEEYQAKK